MVPLLAAYSIALVIAASSGLSFVVGTWIGWSVSCHRLYDRPGVTLRQRLRHPASQASQLHRKEG